MIQLLSHRYRRLVAITLYLSFYFQILASMTASAAERPHPLWRSSPRLSQGHDSGGIEPEVGDRQAIAFPVVRRVDSIGKNYQDHTAAVPARRSFLGGPSTPESGSFKSVNADNLVNLFTGDFSYSVPLLDVGGYPVNIFYNGGIGMEQEASWVGLGWNINPGSVSRNMRGVPDDFDGSDTLIQQQNVKPNKTWGGVVGVDNEELGVKRPNFSLNLGFSFNNYLGPELDLGTGVSIALPSMESVVDDDRAPDDSIQGLGLSLGVNAKLSSRSGLTLSPSLNANLSLVHLYTDAGVGLSTSYNSRTGIQNLNIHGQVQANAYLTSRSKDKNGNDDDFRAGLGSDISRTTISFARPSYIPTLRMPMKYSNYSGQLELGAGFAGLRGAATVQGYFSETQVASTVIYKPMVGYMYLEKANGRTDPVMDFNRVNDGPVTPHTPIISAPQYDYDIFTIQGEGTGGSIRAYRNDIGFMRDHLTTSTDKSFSLGFDIAPGGHFGGNVNVISTPTMSGTWNDGNNTLYQSLLFGANAPNTKGFEHVYFRNPGEATVTNDVLINKIGRDNLVRFLVDGSTVSPMLESSLEQFSKITADPVGSPIRLANANDSAYRDERSQVITMLSAADASKVGLDTALRTYADTLAAGNQLSYTSIPRVGGYRKAHHISEITVLEANGMRYVYGIPVYSVVQKDFTLSVRETPSEDTSNLVQYAADESTTKSQNITSNTGIDGYFSMQQTPAYASSFLITGLLSPDYVDRTGDGITEDDLGNAVKFDYTMSTGVHRWRTPQGGTSTAMLAHFNVGLKSEVRDNKAAFSYGEREAWYLHAIESKSLIAIFSTSNRNDDKGVDSATNAETNGAENVNQKLDSICLYTKADIRAHGLTGAVPIKTVHFDYTYALCKGTPDNLTGEGKLTLRDIYFTFNGQSRVSKDMYVFNYGDTNYNFDNARYAPNASDKWGTYKPVKDSTETAVNPNGLNNVDYPYTSTKKAADDQYAGEWSLKKILLPSGGQIEVSYESDDYAYVQDRRACNMYQIYGIGNGPASSTHNQLYSIYSNQDQNYVYVKVPTPLFNKNPAAAKQEIFVKYLQTLKQLAFKLNVNMPAGVETLTTYAGFTDYGLCPDDTTGTIIYLELATIDGNGPLANAAVQFLINNLPGEAFTGYDLSEDTGLQDFFALIVSALGSIFSAFQNAVSQMRSAGKANTISLATSFVRLCSPSFVKYGGGHRVKRILLKDNWNKMTQEYLSTYGQDYDYTTTQDIDGVPTTISSGVASYEPGIGSEENPFREILQYSDKLPLASAQYGAIEMPVLEGFYGGPVVGYSQVTVRSIHRNGTHGDSIVRSAIGKQVTQYYTAKDFPAYSVYTPMNNFDYHDDPPFSFWRKETIDQRTTSEGFLVVTNDMHGKLRSQAVYSEGDPNTRLSFTIHTYKNTGVNGMNDLVQFVHNDHGGTITSGNIGIDMELMTSVREFDEQSHGVDDEANVDIFTIVPFPIFGVFYYPLSSYAQNTYKEVNTTKLINYHAVEDSVIVNDKGSVVTTKTLLYDAQTGAPVVTQTSNEFKDPIYNISYPAYWAYSGMGPAYKNIGAKFSGVNISGGQILGGTADSSLLESGDELLVNNPPPMQFAGPSCLLGSHTLNKLWVVDLNKDTSALTIPTPNRNLLIMDSVGHFFTGANVSFTIIRSGHRNDLGLTAGTVTAMRSPIQTPAGVLQLVVDSSDSAVSAAATAYREKWQTDADAIPTTVTIFVNCTPVDSPSCSGTLPTHINPYTRGLLGNFKAFRNFVFYGSRIDSTTSIDTRIRNNGFISHFCHYWNFNPGHDLVPNLSNTNWLWNVEVTKVNSKGQELETHDALNRYTAAQYGFAKNFPVAVTQNARDGQSFGEGFEDYGYNESLNRASTDTCANAKYFSFSGVANSSIINTKTDTLHAHTGQYYLKVNANTKATVPLLVAASPIDTFDFYLKPDTLVGLSNVGYNLIGSTTKPMRDTSGIGPLVGIGPTGAVSGLLGDSGTTTFGHTYIRKTTQYFQIANSGNYSIGMHAKNDGATIGTGFSAVTVTIFDTTGTQLFTNNVTIGSSLDSSAAYSQFLCAGYYKVQVQYEDDFSGGNTAFGIHALEISYSINSSSNTYKDLSKATTCFFKDPIRASDSMFNQTFMLVPGQKMQFSGWMHQDCGNTPGTPCYLTNYSGGYAIIKFPIPSDTTSDTVRASGPIIEGWQKVEGTISVPATATTADLIMESTSGFNVYFDDLRLHPFNADMKTYVYDPRTLRLMAELDENNYATIYNYDEEGQLIRVKKETMQGIKTIKETRTAKQKSITNVQ